MDDYPNHYPFRSIRISDTFFSSNMSVSVFDVLIGFGLFTCCVGSSFWLSGIISIILFSVYIIEKVFCQPHELLKYFPFYFAVIANIAGCAVCEYVDIYLTELLVYSGFSGSLPLLVLSRWVFLLVLSFFDGFFGVEGLENGSNHATKFIEYVTYCVFAIILGMFIYVAPNPSFVAGVDRFVYERNLPSVFAKASTWMALLILFPVLSIKEAKNKAGIASVVIYVLYLLWTGNKFGSFLSLGCVFIYVYYDEILKLGRRALAHLCFSALVLLAVLIVGAVFLQSSVSSSSSNDYLLQRAAQQGQLWWKTYSQTEEQIDLAQFEKELSGFAATDRIESSIGAQHGIYGVMYRSASSSVVNAKLSTGARYTEAGYAVAYYCFGSAGPVMFSLVMGLLIALVMNALLRTLIAGNIVESFILLRLNGFLQTGLCMGLFSQFFTPLTLSMIAFLILMRLVRLNERAGNEAEAGVSQSRSAVYGPFSSTSFITTRKISRFLISQDRVIANQNKHRYLVYIRE